MQVFRRLLLPGSWILCFFTASVPGQATLPAGMLTPDSLSRSCASQPAQAGEAAGACRVALAGRYTLQLQGDWSVPRSMHLQFAPGSVLQIAGGVLDFRGGSMDADTNDFLFPDTKQVRGLAASRPEWFTATGEDPVPGDALAAAYLATEPWGTIYLQARQYVSPFDGCSAVAARLPYASPRTFVGAGRPSPDSPTEPSRLLGGTILLGGIAGTAPLRATHLGFDAGPQAALSPQHPCGNGPAVFIEQPGSHVFVSGDRLEDVSVLTMGTFNMHSVMIAGHQNTEVRDLWIWTLGGTHGLVMKSSNSVVDGLHCWGAVSDCLIVKSDYATDLLGRATHDRVTHVDIHPLRPGGTVGGIFVDSAWDTVHSLDIRDVTETGTRYGLVIYGSRFYRPHNISIENWTTDAVNGMCVWVYHTDRLHISNFKCGMLPSGEAGIVLLDDKGTTLQNVRVTCNGNQAACAAAHTDGVLNDAEGTVLEQVTAEGLGGYALQAPHAGQSSGQVQAVGMSNRAFLPEHVSWKRRTHDLLTEVKPDLRIAYTMVTSQMILHPDFFHALIVLTGIVVLSLLVLRRVRFPGKTAGSVDGL